MSTLLIAIIVGLIAYKKGQQSYVKRLEQKEFQEWKKSRKADEEELRRLRKQASSKSNFVHAEIID